MQVNLDVGTLDFRQELVYSIEGADSRSVLAVFDGEASDANLHVHSAAVNGVISLSLANHSDKTLIIHTIDSCIADTLPFDTDWENLQVMVQGRHKNDIPSIVTLGCRDGALDDALGGMQETGDVLADTGTRQLRLVSDTLTLIQAGEDKLMLAFPEAEHYFCRCVIDVSGSAPVLRAGCTPEITLRPQEKMNAEPLQLQSGTNALHLIERFAAAKASRLPKPVNQGFSQTPAVYCTWYYYGLTVSEADVLENLEEARRQQLPVDVFQIDEGWEVTLGQWEANEKFPGGMKALAGKIQAAGFIPGIWTSPFIAHTSAEIWQSHPEWKLRDGNGAACQFPMNDTVYEVLDITNPAVWTYVEGLYRLLTEVWGYRYHKLDFTRAAVLYEEADFHNKHMALPEAYRQAMQAVRRGIGASSYLLVCGGLYDPIIDIADAQRTGSDVLSMWRSTINKDGKTVPFTVKQNLLRFHMQQWWDNDADCLMLRRQSEMSRGLRLSLGLLNEEEVKTMLVNQYLSAGLFSMTERLSIVDPDRLWRIRHLLPLRKFRTYPLLFVHERFPSTVAVVAEGLEQLVFVNWEDDECRPLSIQATGEPWSMVQSDLKATCTGRYLLSEFFSGAYKIVEAGESVTFPSIAAHGAAIVRRQQYEPTLAYVVASSGHFALGAEFERLELSAEGELQISLPYVASWESVYTILLPSGFCPQQPLPDGVSVLAGKPELLQLAVSKPGRHKWTIALRQC